MKREKGKEGGREGVRERRSVYVIVMHFITM